MLTIAHRLSTLAHSDRILVLEKGEVVEFGSPVELQRKEKGWYKDMVEKNSKEFLIWRDDANKNQILLWAKYFFRAERQVNETI